MRNLKVHLFAKRTRYLSVVSEARRVPKVGKVIALPWGTGQEPIWYVVWLTTLNSCAVLHLEHLLDRDRTCIAFLWPEGKPR